MGAAEPLRDLERREREPPTRSGDTQHAPPSTTAPLVKMAYLPDPVRGAQNKRGHRKPVPLFFGRLQREGNVEFKHITVQDIMDDVLVQGGFTLLCVPGSGFASSFVSRLGSAGEQRIVAFVKAGGGFMGIGSGAYLGSNWGYRLLDVDIMDMQHWKRGVTDECLMQWTAQGQRVLRAAGGAAECKVKYVNGPLFRVNATDKIQILSTYQTELRGKKQNYPPIMKDSPAIVMGKSARGMVCLVSPHVFEGDHNQTTFAQMRNLFCLCSGNGSSISRDPTVVALQAVRPARRSLPGPLSGASQLLNSTRRPVRAVAALGSDVSQGQLAPAPAAAPTPLHPVLTAAASSLAFLPALHLTDRPEKAEAAKEAEAEADPVARALTGQSASVSLLLHQRPLAQTPGMQYHLRARGLAAAHQLSQGSRVLRPQLVLAGSAFTQNAFAGLGTTLGRTPPSRILQPALAQRPRTGEAPALAIVKGLRRSEYAPAAERLHGATCSHTAELGSHLRGWERRSGEVAPVRSALPSMSVEVSTLSDTATSSTSEEDVPSEEAPSPEQGAGGREAPLSSDQPPDAEWDVGADYLPEEEEEEEEEEEGSGGEAEEEDDDDDDDLEELDAADTPPHDRTDDWHLAYGPPPPPPAADPVAAAAAAECTVHRMGGCSCHAEDGGGNRALSAVLSHLAKLKAAPRKWMSKLSSAVAPSPVPAVANSVAGLNRQVLTDGYTIEDLPYMESLAGPILFTAPHSLKLHRGGEEEGERQRIHLRERWSSEVAAKLARTCHEHLGFVGSVVVWNPKTAKKKDPANLDPNYLTAAQQPASPWHHALHRFRERFDGGATIPILHVDVHGKKDRKTNLDVDVGLGPMEVLWGIGGVQQLKSHIEAGLREVFAAYGKTFRSRASRRKKEMPFTVRVDPQMNGYWGNDTYQTISHQSVLLGTPSLQLEIPYTMRQELVNNDALMRAFAKVLCSAYTEVVLSGKIGEQVPSAIKQKPSAKQRSELEEMAQLMPPPLSLDITQVDNLLRDLRRMDKASREKVI